MSLNEKKLKLFLVTGTVFVKDLWRYFTDLDSDQETAEFKDYIQKNEPSFGTGIGYGKCQLTKYIVATNEREALDNAIEESQETYLDDKAFFDTLLRSPKITTLKEGQKFEALTGLSFQEGASLMEPVEMDDWMAEEVIVEGYEITVTPSKKKLS